MDAFSVSVADGLNEPSMRKAKGLLIALVFGLFQGLMPMAGWTVLVFAEERFQMLSSITPYIGFVLLLFIGIKMIVDAVKDKGGEAKAETSRKLTFGMLLIQGIATSIDALSVGFTLSGYGSLRAFAASAVIASVTFIICTGGVFLGKKIGKRFMHIAPVIGGVILILVGAEILISSILS